MYIALAILAFHGIAFATPTAVTKQVKRCAALIEENPWTVSNLSAFDAAPGPSGVSYISFHFCDTNTGLQLDTTCSRYLAAGSGQSPIDPDNYYQCGSDYVRFIYSGDTLQLERSYTDPCLGDPPYDSAIAFGHASTQVVNVTTAAGNMCTQAQMMVNITEES